MEETRRHRCKHEISKGDVKTRNNQNNDAQNVPWRLKIQIQVASSFCTAYIIPWTRKKNEYKLGLLGNIRKLYYIKQKLKRILILA